MTRQRSNCSRHSFPWEVMVCAQDVLFLVFLGLDAVSAFQAASSFRVQRNKKISHAKLLAQEIECPPAYVSECNDAGFCMCINQGLSRDHQHQVVKRHLEPEVVAKMAREAQQWLANGYPYSLAQSGAHQIA